MSERKGLLAAQTRLYDATHLLLVVGFIIVDHARPSVLLFDIVITKVLGAECVAALLCHRNVVKAGHVSEHLGIAYTCEIARVVN